MTPNATKEAALRELALKCPIVASWMHRYDGGEVSMEDATFLMVVALVTAKEVAMDSLREHLEICFGTIEQKETP